MLLISVPKKDITNEPKSALKKPSTSNPGASLPRSRSNAALITKINKPRVIMLIGRVISIISGFMKIFISAIITTTSMALLKPSTSIPGISQAVNIIASANKTHLKSKIISFLLIFIFNIYKPTAQANSSPTRELYALPSSYAKSSCQWLSGVLSSE